MGDSVIFVVFMFIVLVVEGICDMLVMWVVLENYIMCFNCVNMIGSYI